MYHFLLHKHLKKTKRRCGPRCMLGWLLNGGAPLTTEPCMEQLIKRPKDPPEEGYVTPYSLGPTLISILTTAAWHRGLEASLKTDREKSTEGHTENVLSNQQQPGPYASNMMRVQYVENVYVMYIYYCIKYSIFLQIQQKVISYTMQPGYI